MSNVNQTHGLTFVEWFKQTHSHHERPEDCKCLAAFNAGQAAGVAPLNSILQGTMTNAAWFQMMDYVISVLDGDNEVKNQ